MATAIPTIDELVGGLRDDDADFYGDDDAPFYTPEGDVAGPAQTSATEG